MAKRSAKSKGYRRSNEKKPYLTKKDIIMLCVLLAAVAAAAILLFSYDDGALKTQDGKIVDAQDNWLIVNGAANNGRRYYKLGELGEVKGYALTNEVSLSDPNLMSHIYKNDAETGIQTISVSCAAAKPDRAAEYYRSLLSAASPTEVESDGDSRWFSYKTSYYKSDEEAPAEDAAEPAEGEEVEDEEHEPNRFEQALHVYFPAIRDYSIGVSVQAKVDSEDDWIPDEQLMEVANKVYAAITQEAK